MNKFAKIKLENQFIVDMSKVLGKGSTGCVYEGINIHNNEKVAVKVIDLSTIDN
jgi:serine/threonine protein kinase